uniref:BZIP domain-containing protein n=1 Tax=Caenorhabditis tropicalis TaxID=1561998 RepID=A0A1I7TSI0_9PELO
MGFPLEGFQPAFRLLTSNQFQERDQSRRSVRPSSSSATRSALRGAARFQDDSMLPPTAAYHTQNQTTRVRRGPKSCPPEYVDEEPPRSFNVDSFRREPRRQRHQMIPSSSSMMTSSQSSRVPYQQRWETSEYGSENTSPIGYHRHQQHHRRRQEEEEEEEDDEETEEETSYKKSRYQELKRKIRAHYEERLFNYERAQRNDHRQIKELEKEKDDLVKMLLQSNAKLEKEKKKTEYFKRKWQEAEQQIKIPQLSQQNTSFGQFGFQVTPPQFPHQMYQFSQSGGQRYSFMGAPMHPISSSNTPTTSAMDTTTGGGAGKRFYFKGESLVPASDVSFMAPMATVSSTLPPLDISANSGPSTSNPGGNVAHQQPSTSNFFPEDDEDQDEIKNFRDEEIEVPRGSLNTLKNEDLIDSSEFLNDSYMVTLQEGKDSGFSTTPDDEKKAQKEATAVH